MFNKFPLFFLFMLMVGLLQSCNSTIVHTPSWKLVYQNDLNGEPLYGSKEQLVRLLKSGNPVRVSWGERLEDGSSCIEFSEPGFTTLMNNNDLVVQFPSSLIQTDYINSRNAFLNVKKPTRWHALMSTDGHYHQFHSKLGTEEITRVMYLRARMSWFIHTHETIEDKGSPLPLDTSGGIVLDSISTF